MKIEHFENIEVWQLARLPGRGFAGADELARTVYRLTKKTGFERPWKR